MIHTFQYHNKDSNSDYGLRLTSLDITPPTVRKTEVTIPFRSSTIDMEDVIGDPTYDDRTINVKFWRRCESRESRKRLEDDIIQWLMTSTKKDKFVDSDQPEKVFKACIMTLDFSESTNLILRGTLVLKANPYYINKESGEEMI